MSCISLHLIRHAPVTGKDGIIYGDDAEIDVSQQKNRLGELKEELPAFSEALWYYSGIRRTFETAKAVKIDGFDSQYLTAHEGWKEQSLGALIGKTHEEVRPHLEFIDGKIFSLLPPEGEALDAFISRAGKAVSDIRQQARHSQKRNIVVFTHGGTIRAAHAHLNNLDGNGFIKLDTPPLCLYTAKI